MYKLHHTDGSFTVIVKSDLPLSVHEKVDYYYSQFRNSIEKETIAPPEACCQHLKDKFGWLYQKIFNSIAIEHLQVKSIDALDLYYFFVATVENNTLSLSFLAKLLGYECYDRNMSESDTIRHEGDEDDEERPTTGNLVLDVKVSTLLNFKHAGSKLIETHSLSQLLAMNKMAGECYELAQAKAEEEAKNNASSKHKLKVPKMQPTPERNYSDRPEFISNKSKIGNEITKLGKKLPTGF